MVFFFKRVATSLLVVTLLTVSSETKLFAQAHAGADAYQQILNAPQRNLVLQATALAELSTTATFTNFLSLVARPPTLIASQESLIGHITLNGKPAVGEVLTVQRTCHYSRRDDQGSYLETVSSAVTNSEGMFIFTPKPLTIVYISDGYCNSLRVVFNNGTPDNPNGIGYGPGIKPKPNHILYYQTEVISPMDPGDAFLETFDIGGIQLVEPISTTKFPAVFRWTARSSNTAEYYWLMILDFNGKGICFDSGDLGYRQTFTVTSSNCTIGFGNYTWIVWMSNTNNFPYGFLTSSEQGSLSEYKPILFVD